MIGFITLGHGVHGTGIACSGTEQLLRLFTVNPAMFPADSVTVDFVGSKSGNGILVAKLYYSTAFQNRAAVPSGTLAATFPSISGAAGKFRASITLAKPAAATLLKIGVVNGDGTGAGDIQSPRLVIRV